ncbi:hypothetical protein AS594_21710 [Streptomyces agglomeratus]|uniref:Uncharacterized protein n=1 Tax=Streptomyces agglomeratus TaxID=285458 RepID=A0A1E5PB21_9ACTN|nr:hypothetical protein [Streptomyces agglomeratus]OEJ26718.1 hypothetical protein AS594_21710 [Streptomyces agglomeratus]
MSDDFELEEMRRFVTQYESCEDPYLRSEFLQQTGTTFAVVRRYRQLIAAADRALAANPTARPGFRADRGRRGRRSRPTPVRPPGHARNRRRRSRVTVVVTVHIVVELS